MYVPAKLHFHVLSETINILSPPLAPRPRQIGPHQNNLNLAF